MDDRKIRQLEERVTHLEIDQKWEKEWESFPDSQKPTSKGRWDQMKEEVKLQESRRLGFPNNY